MKLTTKAIFGLVMACFWASGMAGLVYQVVWARYLALFLGHTSYAIVAVLVAFMAGLAIGNAWFGRRADAAETPLAMYGWLELAIAIYAVLFPHYVAVCQRLYVGMAPALENSPLALLLLKFAFSLATILLPTTLMGATFPVLTRYVTRALDELREKVAALYFINSFGAVAGALAAEFWWIPAIGLEMTVYAAAGLNLVAGLIALFVSKTMGEPGLPSGAARAKETPPAETFTARELRLALFGIGASGFVAMLYEVAWTRLLALVLGSSSRAFTLMLVTFIAGIALGSWIVYRWRSLRRTLDAFAWAEGALALTLLGSMFFYQELPFWFSELSRGLSQFPAAYPLYQLVQAAICFLVMFVPATCLGMTLPFVSRIATAELASAGRSVGGVFAVNTLGTVLGAAVTGLWLMPSLGLARTFGFGLALNALICLLILGRNWKLSPALLGAGSALFMVLLVALSGWQFDSAWQRAFSLGLWRDENPPRTRAAYQEKIDTADLVFHRDGAGATVSVLRWTAGSDTNYNYTLKINGKPDASTGADLGTQLLLGHIPLLLNPAASNVLVIGLGSGMTCGAVLRHTNVQTLYAVEISPEVPKAAEFFAAHNDNVLQNPRFKLRIEDAKSFLAGAPYKFDVISSEPSNPWMAGVAAVFSREYYETCRDHLQPNGLMAQWVQYYEMDNSTLEMVFATFGSVFPYFSVWHATRGDLILVGSLQPITGRLEDLEARFLRPAIQADLSRMSLTNFPQFLALEVVSDKNAAFIPSDNTRIHSDYFPVLEYAAQRAFFARSSGTLWQMYEEKLSSRPATFLGRYLAKRQLDTNDFQAITGFYSQTRFPIDSIFRSMLFEWESRFPDDPLPLLLGGAMSDSRQTAEIEALRLAQIEERILRLGEKEVELLQFYERVLFRAYRARRSAFHLPDSEKLTALLKRLLDADPANHRVYKLHLAELAWDQGQDAECLKLGFQAFDESTTLAGPVQYTLDPGAPQAVLARMIESYWRAGQIKNAWQLCESARAQGFVLDETSDRKNPNLELVYRKVRAYAAQAAQNTNPTP